MDKTDFSFGITLDQIDELNSLIRLIAAQGDVISVGNAARLDDRSLPALGESIYEAACLVHGILLQVCEQDLKHLVATKVANSVKETPPVYLGARHSRNLGVDPFMREKRAVARRAVAAKNVACPRSMVVCTDSKAPSAAVKRIAAPRAAGRQSH